MGDNKLVRYVAGFAFTPSMGSVALIEKKRPGWQAGKLNGIGGHIEEGESEYEAMRREFREEAGQDIQSWTKFCVLSGKGFEVTFFYCCEELNVHTVTDEEICIVPVGKLWRHKTIPNLHWLIPMARQMSYEAADSFVVQEVG